MNAVLDIQSLDFYQAIERAADVKHLLDLLDAFARQTNARAGWVLAHQVAWNSSWRINTIGDLPKCFVEALRDPLARAKDPLWQKCESSLMPVLWDRSTYEQAGLHEQASHMASENVSCGIAVSMRSELRMLIGMLCWPQADVVRSENAHETLPRALMVATHLDSAAHRLQLYPAPDPLPEDLASLTPRELEVLRWSSLGKTEWEIGKILSLSEYTVSDHLESASRRLNCGTRIQAVVKALRAGLLS